MATPSQISHIKVKVKVTLRPTVSPPFSLYVKQSVGPSVKLLLALVSIYSLGMDPIEKDISNSSSIVARSKASALAYCLPVVV
jgi:hypothetical protein